MRIPFLWIVDPWEKLAPFPLETTLRLAEETLRMGLRCSFAEARSLRIEDNHLRFTGRELLEVAPGRESSAFRFGPPGEATLSDFRQAHYRVDPPIDLVYLHPLQMIALFAKGARTEVVNPASALFEFNEKFIASLEPSLTAPTLISADRDSLLRFGKREGKAVLKPLHQAASRGVELLDFSTPVAEERIRSTSSDYRQPVLLQRYLPGIETGETRLWFIDGKLLAHARKRPISGDFRVDIDGGSAVEAMPLASRDKKAIPKIAKILRKGSIRLAAVDLIDGKITDFNFTSPGLIVQMEKTTNQNLSKKILQGLLKSP